MTAQRAATGRKGFGVSPRSRTLLRLAAWMIGLPLVLAFFAGAAAGTFLDGLAGVAGAVFAVFGWISIALGVVLLAWVGWPLARARWRDRHDG